MMRRTAWKLRRWRPATPTPGRRGPRPPRHRPDRRAPPPRHAQPFCPPLPLRATPPHLTPPAWLGQDGTLVIVHALRTPTRPAMTCWCVLPDGQRRHPVPARPPSAHALGRAPQGTHPPSSGPPARGRHPHALAPHDRMRSPSWTARTRSTPARSRCCRAIGSSAWDCASTRVNRLRSASSSPGCGCVADYQSNNVEQGRALMYITSDDQGQTWARTPSSTTPPTLRTDRSTRTAPRHAAPLDPCAG